MIYVVVQDSTKDHRVHAFEDNELKMAEDFINKVKSYGEIIAFKGKMMKITKPQTYTLSEE